MPDRRRSTRLSSSPRRLPVHGHRGSERRSREAQREKPPRRRLLPERLSRGGGGGQLLCRRPLEQIVSMVKYSIFTPPNHRNSVCAWNYARTSTHIFLTPYSHL